MNIIVQNTSGYASSINVKIESPNKTFVNITRYILLNSSQNKEKIGLTISIPYGYPTEVIIYCMLMLIMSAGMEQYFRDLFHPKTSNFSTRALI